MKIPNSNQVYIILDNHKDCCIKCLSTNIANEDESDEITCHDCSHQFTEDDMKEKTHIVALLMTNNQKEAAKVIEQMTMNEYNEFVEDYLESDDC